MKALKCLLVIFFIVAFPNLFALPARGEEPNPHGRNAKHPEEVVRIMKLLCEIPADASEAKIIAFLGLPEKATFGFGDEHGTTMYWDVAPGYRFRLHIFWGFGKPKLSLAEFAATGKPGFPPEEYHTLYPYRSGTKMIEEEQKSH
jgi:hypothetical protein